jgi:hypothetical protein
VVRYVGVLRLALQDMVSMFDPITVAATHQRALRVERQVLRQITHPISVGASTSNNTAPMGNYNFGRKVVGGTTTAMVGGVRCFNCGETCHQRAEWGLCWWSDGLVILLQRQMIDGYALIFSNLHVPSRTRCENL